MVISWIMLVFFLLGAIDYALGGRFGLSEEFVNGLMACGRLLICMSGFMILAPVIAGALGPAIAPFFRSFGADPSAIAGLLLANDSGGFALALEMADTREAALFNGLIVGAGIGTTVMFFIYMTMSSAKGAQRVPVIGGLLSGIITAPLGCLAGGFAAGFSASLVLRNSIPVLGISAFLMAVLLLFGNRVVPVFIVFGRFLELVSIFGLCCGAVAHLTGYLLIPGMDTLETVFPVVGGISIFLSGAFPLLAVVRKLFAPALDWVGRMLRVNQAGVSGLLLGLANGIPTVSMLPEMDDRGRLFAVAALVSGSCIFGDHAAYTSQVAPDLVGPVIISKAVGSITAMALAWVLAPKFVNGEGAAGARAEA